MMMMMMMMMNDVRCYIALAQAATNVSCASLVGPPGHGKTETIKDVAKCLGKFIVVFGCSDQMGVLGIDRVFKGSDPLSA